MQTKRLSIALGITATVIAVLLIVPNFIDWSKYRTLAQTKVKEATGYDLGISGSLSLAILPAPHASIKGVTVAKGGRDPFLTLEEANVRVALFPLLAGKIEIADIKFEKPALNLITFKDGTDNYMPVKPAVQAPATDPVTGQPVVAKATDTQGQSIAVNGLHIKDGSVTIRDEAKGTTQNIGINDLHVKADTLEGPFDGDGDITYGNARFDISLSTGGYKKGETLPVQLNIKEKDDRASLKYSGIMEAGDKPAIQGEASITLGDLPGLLKDIGVTAAVPSLGDRTQLTGMLSGNADRLSLTNGTLILGKTKFNTRVDAAMGPGGKNITGVFETNDVLDVDAMEKIAADASKDSKKDSRKNDAAPAKKSTAPASTLVPLGFTIPAALTADIRLAAAGLQYKGEKTGAFTGRVTASKGVGNVAVTLAAIPGGGNINVVAATTPTPGEIAGTATGTLPNLKATLADWLEVVSEDTFKQPGMPQSATLDSAFRIEGNAATLTIRSLAIGEPQIAGTVSYVTGAKPVLNAQLRASSWTLPAPQGQAASKATAAKSDVKKDSAAPAKFDFDINPPQLPFATKFDVTIDRLVKGDLIVTALRVIGDYDGKGALNLTSAAGTLSGGTVTASGKVADLKELSGIDMQAALKTSNLDSFVTAITGKPFNQKITDFNGALKAVGSRKGMDVTASVQAKGYTLEATGHLDDPFSPEIPGTINMRVRNPNIAGKPADVTGTAKINGKVYTISDLKGQLGPSDITGSVKADLSGDKPDITAEINSNTLDAGALLGVKDKTAKTSSSATSATAASADAGSPVGHWSREAIDTAFLRAANVDVKLNAGTLRYGTWTVSSAKAGVTLKDGALKVSPLSGGIYGGTLDGQVNASSVGTGQPLNVIFKADVNNVAIGPFMQALTSSTTKRADGTGSVAIDIKGAGASAYQLVGSLNGEAKVKADNLIIYGMNIDKLAADIVEAFDGGWKGVLSGFAQNNLTGGQTSFKDVSQTFAIQAGTMPINNFRLETANGNAIVLTNGMVSFVNWTMNTQSNVQVTQPKDVPVIGIALSGPLNAPQKQISSQALDNLIRNKIGGKVQDLIGKKLGTDSPAGALINNLLGGGQPQQQAPATVTPTPAPVVTDPAAPQTAPVQTAPVEVQPQTQKDPRQELLEGVFNQLVK